MIRTGLENLLTSPPEFLAGNRLGLLCNQASVDTRFAHARHRIDRRFPGRLTAIFSPQHGFFGEKQDNMIESDHLNDPGLNVPIYSLYGKTRIPSPEMLASVDTLLVDLQDVGTRVYTFVYTLSYCMEAARRLNKKIVVLDRPNPINGIQIEGHCLDPAYASFVGRYPIPMRHGLTIGELAMLFNDTAGIGCDLDVIPMTGWRRHMYYGDTGLPWVAPSPNLPTPASAMVYPGQVLWEGTNISEGRGTTQPFELCGAPFLDTDKLLTAMGGKDQRGAVLRKTVFEPTSGKWAGCLCNGFQIHVLDPVAYRPYTMTLRLLQAVLRWHPDRFEWKSPPYEYEFEKLPIDLIAGGETLRRRLENFDEIEDIEKGGAAGRARFDGERKRFFLYS